MELSDTIINDIITTANNLQIVDAFDDDVYEFLKSIW